MRLNMTEIPKMVAKYDSFYYNYSTFSRYFVRDEVYSNLEIQS
jgi:hypothetical protein